MGNLNLFFIMLLYLIIITAIYIFYSRKLNQLKDNIAAKADLLKDVIESYDTHKQLIESKQEELNTLNKKVSTKIEEMDTLSNDLADFKVKIDKEKTEYLANYKLLKEQEDLEYQNKKNELEEDIQKTQNELNKIKTTLQAGIENQLREQEKELDVDFFRINISVADERDIELLNEIKHKISNKAAIGKVIWSTYCQKETNALCHRVLGSNSICGIYKIQNIKTKETYIGQSVNVAERWKQHIKCGCGVDTPAANRLYNNMQKYGVWNFTFELIETCSREELNEKEARWIDMYQSNISGLNTTKGVTK